MVLTMSTEAPQTVCTRPFSEDDREAYGRIVARAFPDKLAAMLRGARLKGPALLSALVDPPNTWMAERDGRPVGTATVQDTGRPAAPHRVWPLLRRHLAPPAAARARLHLLLIHTVSVPPDLLYLDLVAVDPEAQGDGVGGALLDLVVDEARRRGKTAVGLYVIARNWRARALYERRGFVARHSEHLWLFAGVAGFSDTVYMELEIDASGGASTKRPAQQPQAPAGGGHGGRLAATTSRLFDAAVERGLWRRGPAPPPRDG